MLRKLEVKNFRSLVTFALEIASPYFCVVGTNNVGKSNIVTALKWLSAPTSMSPKGIPWVDLSRTARGLDFQFFAEVELGVQNRILPDGRLLTHGNDLIGVRRAFVLQGDASDPVRMQIQSEYAPLTSSLVRIFFLDGTSEWAPFEHIEGFLPKVVHIRPSDVGRISADGTPEAELARLRWPQELTNNDLDWVKSYLARLFDPPNLNSVNLTLHDETRSIGFWDDYGHPVPLRKAGSGTVQVAYTLMRIALARQQIAGEGSLARALMICIDEPEQHLSSGLQKAYADILMEIAEEQQIIVTSHSGLFIKRGVEGATSVLVRHYQNNGTTALAPKISTLTAVRETLGISMEDSLAVGEVNILVEGPTEAVALPSMLSRLAAAEKTTLLPERITFIQRDGASRIPSFANLVGQLGLGLVTLLDNDTPGRDADRIIAADPTLTYAQRLLIPLTGTLREAEFEDLFPRLLVIDVTSEHLARRNASWNLTEADFQNLYTSADYWLWKKWGDCLAETLIRKGYLQKGQKPDVILSKSAVMTDLLARLDVDSIPKFMTDIFIPAVETALAQQTGLTGIGAHVGILVNTHATSWVHETTITDTLDHDS